MRRVPVDVAPEEAPEVPAWTFEINDQLITTRGS